MASLQQTRCYLRDKCEDTSSYHHDNDERVHGQIASARSPRKMLLQKP